jgi:hypothetical protein
VKLTALSTAIEMLCVFSYQHCCLFDGDRRARDATRLAPGELELFTANDDLLCLQGYSALHQLAPFSTGELIDAGSVALSTRRVCAIKLFCACLA